MTNKTTKTKVNNNNNRNRSKSTNQNKPKKPNQKQIQSKNQSAGNSKPNVNRAKSQKRNEPKKEQLQKLKVIPLGGLHEIGKNMTLLEYGDDIIAIDCGMMFPNQDQYGIDAVIPDFTYLIENSKKFKAVFITHAHEDHIGGVAYLLKQFNVPIFCSKLAEGFIKNRLKEHKSVNPKFKQIKEGETIKIGCFKVSPIRTTHSVADSYALVIDTPVGKVFHTGDFKVDYTPVDNHPFNVGKFAKIGDDGVLLLMADSTNAVKSGYTLSEQTVGESLGNIFAKTKNRIIIATFSSHIHRLQEIVDLAHKHRRKVAVSGRSMESTFQIAKELGYLNIPANTMISLGQIKDFNPSEIVVVTTGSQGEPLSALNRMAIGEHKNIKIQKDDVIVLSSSPIPGNEKDVYNIVNTLMEKGANVLYSDNAHTHVSGHACQEELRLLQRLIHPKFFMPVHGEVRHLISHAKIAEESGMKSRNIILAQNGCVLELTKDRAKLAAELVPANPVLVDGLGVGDVGAAVLHERRILSESGVVVISATFDVATDELLSGPIIKTKGLIYVKEYGQMLEDAKILIDKEVQRAYEDGKTRTAIEKIMVDTLKKYIYKQINREPVIVPVFMEV